MACMRSTLPGYGCHFLFGWRSPPWSKPSYFYPQHMFSILSRFCKGGPLKEMFLSLAAGTKLDSVTHFDSVTCCSIHKILVREWHSLIDWPVGMAQQKRCSEPRGIECSPSAFSICIAKSQPILWLEKLYVGVFSLVFLESLAIFPMCDSNLEAQTSKLLVIFTGASWPASASQSFVSFTYARQPVQVHSRKSLVHFSHRKHCYPTSNSPPSSHLSSVN